LAFSNAIDWELARELAIYSGVTMGLGIAVGISCAIENDKHQCHKT
jgi:hypothetical protein